MKKSELQQIIREETRKVLHEDLEKNLIQKISKTLKSNNPNIDIKKIIDVVTSWLSQGKNLMTASNAMGDDYKRDVLDVIQNKLT